MLREPRIIFNVELRSVIGVLSLDNEEIINHSVYNQFYVNNLKNNTKRHPKIRDAFCIHC